MTMGAAPRVAEEALEGAAEEVVGAAAAEGVAEVGALGWGARGGWAAWQACWTPASYLRRSRPPRTGSRPGTSLRGTRLI